MAVAGWLGGGLLAAGVGAALLASPAVGLADPGPDTTAAASAHSAPERRAAPKPASRVGTRPPAAAAKAGSAHRTSLSAVPSRTERPLPPQTPTPPAAAVRASAAIGPAVTPRASATAASATSASTAPPVDIDRYVGTWYEQGSVKLPFEWGLVNITANYSLKPDGSLRVLNAGRLFGPNGLSIKTVGSAVPVNAANNRLAVNFFVNIIKGPPGNYWVLDHAPDYSWTIVSDPTHFTGWILTRDAALPAGQYQDLVKQARSLGVWGPITKTKQEYPAG